MMCTEVDDPWHLHALPRRHRKFQNFFLAAYSGIVHVENSVLLDEKIPLGKILPVKETFCKGASIYLPRKKNKYTSFQFLQNLHISRIQLCVQDANAFCLATLWGFITLQHPGVNESQNTCSSHKRSIQRRRAAPPPPLLFPVAVSQWALQR